MITYIVMCKKKHSLYERIEAIGCVDELTGAESRFSEDDAISKIEAKAARFIVRDDKGHEAKVDVEERNGRKFLITKRDGVVTDNLLFLPDCAKKSSVVVPPFQPVAPAHSHGVFSSECAS